MSTHQNNQPKNYQEDKTSDPGVKIDRGINEDEQRKITNQDEGEEESEFYIDGSGEVARRDPYKRADDKKKIENVEDSKFEVN